MSNICPICKQPSLPKPYLGGTNYLVIGGYPKPEELEEGKSLVDYRREFREELFRIGADPRQFAYFSILHHKKGLKKTNIQKELYAKCQSYAISMIMDMAQDKKGLFLLGSEAFTIMTGGLKVSTYSSIPVESPYISEGIRIVGSTKPAQTLGEFRLALQRFMKPFMEK